MPDISPAQWKYIVGMIDKGLCVPFLGAGVNVSSGQYVGLPLGGQLAIRILRELLNLDEGQIKTLTDITIQPLGSQVAIGALVNILKLSKGQEKKLTKIKIRGDVEASKYFKDIARISIYNLARIALHYELEIDNLALKDLVVGLLPDKDRKPSKLLTTLAKLPFKLIVTTNYDRLMERALDRAKRPYKVVVQPVSGFTPDEQTKLRDELAGYNGLIVYKLHGSFYDPPKGGKGSNKLVNAVPPRLIITEEDYIEFLTIVGIEDVGVPKLIAEKIVDSALLFLGYGLEDWDFRTLFKGLNEKIRNFEQRRSFAIQKNPSEFWVDFWERKKVNISDMDLYEFSEKLYEQYQKR